MKQLKLTARTEKDWSKQFVEIGDFTELIKETCTVYKPDGSPLLVLLKDVIPRDVNSLAWSVLRNWNPKTENRSVASGIDARVRIKENGKPSKVTRVPKGWEVISGIVGYFERTVRMPHAHECSWNQKNPAKFAKLFPLVNKVDSVFMEHLPEKWGAQNEIAEKTPADYLIDNTVFTTLTINKNFRTSCHKDAGDLPQGFSCMTVIREGLYSGGYLVLPDFQVGVDLQMGDVILFDPHEFHGNTPILPLTPGATRCSIVYYYREKIQYCMPPAQELERAKNRKQGDPLYEQL